MAWNKWLAAALLFQSGFCFAGKEGGGGIILSAEFATAGREALKILSMGDSTLDLKEILAQVQNVKVIPTAEICYTNPVMGLRYCEDGHFDANSNVILFDQARWGASGCKSKVILAAHEFLRAAGVETEDYSYSGRILKQEMATCSSQPNLLAQDQMKCADLSGTLESKLDQLCHELAFFERDQ